MNKKRCVAVVLAAGKGKRMESDVPKQYIELEGKPILFYSLTQFQQSAIIDEIILVTGKDEINYCKSEIVEKYRFDKVKHIVEGGQERYHSVYQALNHGVTSDYIFIHDGARPFIREEIIEKLYEAVNEYKACVVAVKSKDTVKIADEEGFISNTPNRNYIWNVQTPQVFESKLIKEAYDKLMTSNTEPVTDDAMVVETMLHYKVKLVEGDYENIKVTTPSDLVIAKTFLTLEK